jgi:hypothetical protein
MKSKLIHLLRELEERSGFKNNYEEYDQNYQADYSVEEYLNFPSFKTITKEFNDRYSKKKNNLVVLFSESNVRAELKRMEREDLVIISTQEGLRYSTTRSNQAPDFDEPIKFTSESVILTDRGKNLLDYYIYKAVGGDPVTKLLSVVAIIISVFALLKN